MNHAKKNILIVDDTIQTLRIFYEFLKDEYDINIATSGEAALKRVEIGSCPDLILLDVVMPGVNGYEVCKRLREKAELRHVPIIFLTGKSSDEDKKRGLEVGGTDFLIKPVGPDLLLAQVKTHLEAKMYVDSLSNRANSLEKEFDKRVKELGSIQDVALQVMASLVETRANETSGHMLRAQHYVKLLSLELSKHSSYKAQLDDFTINVYIKSAALHDIGMFRIPHQILLKPGELDSDEFAIMKTHTMLGRDAIELAEISLGIEGGALTTAKEIALSHQEKWDGSGYPHGLRGEEIPLSARIMAVADVYDALTTGRVYRPPMQHDLASEVIIEGAGSHFDPLIVSAFSKIKNEFRLIAERFSDE
ncbi:HD domain-containing phosphohydrolase [Rhodoferax aquaticus]|uniref:Response regulator n=1 Tax=Rhodoferax aquaticus TaxID=2527691 RepID=A0A515ESW4_9BURK|nr:HD domain-containing phosphohydrolase [Rhodoferax aquaticus]QDL55760.1 response regulator [Rhodoferax aquaticus]